MLFVCGGQFDFSHLSVSAASTATQFVCITHIRIYASFIDDERPTNDRSSRVRLRLSASVSQFENINKDNNKIAMYAEWQRFAWMTNTKKHTWRSNYRFFRFLMICQTMADWWKKARIASAILFCLPNYVVLPIPSIDPHEWAQNWQKHLNWTIIYHSNKLLYCINFMHI